MDTNVVVAGLLTKHIESPPAQILDGMFTRRFRFVLSVDLLVEYRRVLLRKPIRKLHRLKDAEIDTILEALTANAILQDPVSHLTDAPPDPGDTHLWRLLAARDGLVLVTGDTALQRCPPPFAGVLSPASFLALMQK